MNPIDFLTILDNISGFDKFVLSVIITLEFYVMRPKVKGET